MTELPTTADAPPRQPALRPAFIVTAVVTLIACAAVIRWPQTQSVTQATFLFGAEPATVRPFDEVPTYDPMALRLELQDAAWVYLVSFDYRRGTVCYYPSEFLGTDFSTGKAEMHRFEAGTWDLPGTWDKKPQSWFVPDGDGALSLCVLASSERLTELEKVLNLCRQVGNRAFQSRSMGHYMPRAGRDHVVGTTKMPHPILQAALHQPDALQPGPMVTLTEYPGILAKTFHIRPSAPRPGVTPPNNPLQGQLKRMAKDQLNVPPQAVPNENK